MWRGGLSPVGGRSRPRTCLLGVSGVTGVGLLGLLRSPARGKPARHSGVAGAGNVERGLLWRGGLSPVGGRSRPRTCLLGVSGVSGVGLLGLLRSPARGKPARHDKPVLHNEPACHSKPVCGNKTAECGKGVDSYGTCGVADRVGNISRNWVTSPGTQLASAWPWCRLMIERTIASPSPVPPSVRARLLSAR